MRRRERVSLDALVSAYQELGSVYAVGRRFGIHGSSVHERLVRHAPGLVKKPHRPWTPERLKRLAAEYERHADNGQLGLLAATLKMAKTEVCRKAGELGLTNGQRARPYLSVWKYMAEEDAAAVWKQFKASSLGLLAWCKRKGYDDLGFSRTMKQFFPDEWESVMEAKQPRTGLYRRGRALEYLVRDDLRKAGFFAQRSPASKTPIDVMGVRPGEVWFVQCKRNGALGVAEWNDLFRVARGAGAVPVLATHEAGRGSLAYFVLLAEKDGTKRPQPMSRVYPMP